MMPPQKAVRKITI